MGTKLEQELLAATGQKEKGKKENLQVFLARVGHAVSDLSDDEYKTLSAPAQAWFTQAAEALSEEPPAPENIKPFSDFEEEMEPEAPEEEKGSEEGEGKKSNHHTQRQKKRKKVTVVKKEKTEAPKGKVTEPDKGKKARADAEAVNTGTKAAKPKEPGVKREGSVADTIRFIMCEDPAMSKDGVGKALKGKKLSFDQSRLDQVYSATARVLQILQELKKLK